MSSQTIVQKKDIGDVIAYEQDSRYSRDIVKMWKGDVVVGQILTFRPQGWVGLGELTGVSVRNCVSLQNKTYDENNPEVLVISRHAILKYSGLVWPNNWPENDRFSAISVLDVRGLVVRGTEEADLSFQEPTELPGK